MPTDVFILNFAVVDFCGSDFHFVEKRVSQGGIHCGTTQEMPAYSQEQYAQWIRQGCATPGGIGNAAPIMAKLGLRVAVGAFLGKGDAEGFDVPGRFFYDEMNKHGIDMGQVDVHPELPTGTAFIYNAPQNDRKGIASFPNSINDIDFERMKKSLEHIHPKVVYYMYSGLSERGDAHQGRDLRDFIAWCTKRGIVTIVDNHTLTDNPEQLIQVGGIVEKYRLLEPLLSEVDIFFTSSDESKLIGNTLFEKQGWYHDTEEDYFVFLETIAEKYWKQNNRTKLFGITVKDGAYQKHCTPTGFSPRPVKVASRGIVEGEINLVGAGDAFRAGLITYIVRHIKDFKNGTIDFNQAVQMANMAASHYIKNSRHDRFKEFDTL